jgi:type I restriction enzyme, S subunit
MTASPSGWLSGALERFIPLQRGFDLPVGDVVPGTIPVVYSNGIGRHHNAAMVDGPGVITGRSGTIGKVHFVEGPYWPHNTALWVTDFRYCDPRFAYHFLEALGLERFSSGSGVPTLNRNDVHSFTVSVPQSREEQRAIALSLDDADTLISSLECMLTKMQAIKQGIAQRLLTGGTRLRGFSGAWIDATAGAIGTFKGGNGFPLRMQGHATGQFPFFKVSDMNRSGNERFMRSANNYISESVRKQLGATAFPPHAIVFAKVGAAVFLERKRILDTASCIDNNMAAMVVDPTKASYRFVHYALDMFRLSSLAATTALPSLNGTQLRSVPLRLPVDLDEQEAIADVLSDADGEVDLRRQRLEKAKATKEGMAQQLLTGCARLRNLESVA